MVKLFRFRHPGFRDMAAEVPVPEVSDLDDRQLRRLVADMRHRIMIRDTFSTVERLFWSPQVSQTVWGIVYWAATEESHARAAQEHTRLGFVFTGFCGARPGRADVELAARRVNSAVMPTSLGAFLRRTVAGASDVRPAERDGKS